MALNEALLFYFSADLDRASVTTDSVRILDEQGRDVAGERVVRGNALSFLPDLPCASDLADGGVRPGTSYRVILGGFPRVDGLRSGQGAPLSSTLLLDFRTAEIGGTSPLFLDPFLGPFALVPRGKRSSPMEIEDGLLVLEYGEALDPSSVPGSRFELFRFPDGAAEQERVPISVRLVENLRDRAVLLIQEIGPDGTLSSLTADKYWLQPGRELRTLGGREVVPSWRLLPFVVPDGRIALDFSSASLSASARPPGCDGTAIWDETKRIMRMRFPAAAGSGSAGPVELSEAPAEADTQATRLWVSEQSVVDLGEREGPVVLRSQTSLEVRGVLRRRIAPASSPLGIARDDPLTDELKRAGSRAPSRWTALSEWIVKVLAPGQPWAREPWTVLIAGGDIRVPEGGRIEVDGPLVLVAGGRIRIEGVAVSVGNLWTSPGGGGMFTRAELKPLPLLLDEPAINPLKTALRCGALTRDFEWLPRKNSWRTLLLGQEGSGRIGVRFLQPGLEGDSRMFLSDPSQLEAGPMQVLLQLEVGPAPGEPWDPPHIEGLRLEAVPGDPRGDPRN